MGLCTIKRSSEFQRVRGGSRAANSSFVIETRPRAADADADAVVDVGSSGVGSSGPRFGFTVTRKIGNAVVRNRIRRRFREALRQLAPGIVRPGHDYVLVARSGVIEQPFDELSRLLAMTIASLHQPGGGQRSKDRKPRGENPRPQLTDNTKSASQSASKSQPKGGQR